MPQQQVMPGGGMPNGLLGGGMMPPPANMGMMPANTAANGMMGAAMPMQVCFLCCVCVHTGYMHTKTIFTLIHLFVHWCVRLYAH